MRRVRLLFSKMGKAKYLSHLDLLRTFQRVFLRAGLTLRHTEGFNPHPYMNFALPLPVGTESVCELLDFDLTDDIELSALPGLLNKTMPEGIEALEAYQPERKFSDIKWLKAEGRLLFDRGVPEDAKGKLEAFFAKKELVIQKKSKKGYAETDIAPLLYRAAVTAKSKEELTMSVVVAAQNPSLNPDNLITAIRKYIPELAPDFAEFRRLAVYDGSHGDFR